MISTTEIMFDIIFIKDNNILFIDTIVSIEEATRGTYRQAVAGILAAFIKIFIARY